MRQHSGKSLSFLMELLLVIFFFMIAASICVLVMSNTKAKNQFAKDVRETLFYGQDLIATESTFLTKDHFYVNEDGIAQDTQAKYEVFIQVIEQGSVGEHCQMLIQTNGRQLVTLDFYRQGETS